MLCLHALAIIFLGQPAVVPRVAGGDGHGHSGDGHIRGHRAGFRRHAALRHRRRRRPDDGLGLVHPDGVRLRLHLRGLLLQRLPSAFAPEQECGRQGGQRGGCSKRNWILEKVTQVNETRSHSDSKPYLSLDSLKCLLTNGPYVVIVLTVGGAVGFFNSMLTLLQQFMCSRGYSNEFSGLCGSLFTGRRNSRLHI